MTKLKIIHTNDLHSHFENFPKIERLIAEKRMTAEQNNEEFLLFDIGDFMDRVHPLTEATNGQANIEWLNKRNYDLVTIGNNEGLGNSHQQLEELFKDANFPVIIGNLKTKATEEIPDFAISSQIYEFADNKVGVLALTAPFVLTYPLVDWDIQLVQDVLPEQIAELKAQGCGTIILMSHLGISMDKRIAKKYPEVNLIIGSHTHHLFEHGEVDGTTQLAAAGKYGMYVGEIDLTLENNQIQDIKVDTIKTAELPEEPNDEQIINDYLELGHELLQQQKIAEVPFDLNNDVTSEHANIHYALKAIEQVAGTDIAVLNNGLFLKELPAGTVTADDIHDLLPHTMHVMKVSLKGQDIWRLFLEMEFNRLFLRRHQQKGMGFRGKYFGELVYDNVKVNIEKRSVLIHDQPIEPEKEYSLATLDHYLFVPYFPTIKIMGQNKLYYPTVIRDVYSQYLKTKFGMNNG
ncbi:bifunctional UDP-sugar hydrolase/5'-nucleotidase [Lactobacillus sp. YT155]|uniref:bifunctional metallophosphatase/5'-nucleotidase n=1 Tax=Lactobacillus sp. YT155 TaxID=3060955 RepID=UPI00265F91B9|nr:bifunctional UDP-sugar hydrolase/5'-nucleotidase [Lactobacillus sp. YT155]MDO1605928.1 bifunctional UDP-sugar hydrolase/5'-nucleotidase [Lactobacillus sp. YT155]